MGLRVQNVSKSFGDKKAVDNLSFAVEEPGVYGLIGTNVPRYEQKTLPII